MHYETGAGTGAEQDGRAFALRMAYAVVEEHPQQAHPAPHPSGKDRTRKARRRSRGSRSPGASTRQASCSGAG